MSSDKVAVEKFQEYLQIRSVHPNVNYEPCLRFLKQYAHEIGLSYKQVYCGPDKPVAIISLEGKYPQFTTLLLNSHMDVVPVTEEFWTYPPFAAEIHEDRVYARGAQDMKSIGIQYLEALRRIKKSGIKLDRTVHCTFVPDEEIGGAFGMKRFVKTPEFLQLNVGVALDEGLPSSDSTFHIYYGERSIWHITFHCPGQPGHGSLLFDDTAAGKVQYLLNKIMQHRDKELQLLKKNPSITIGDVMTLNVTMMGGGQQANVLPSELTMVIDCRIPVNVNPDKWRQTLNDWCQEAGQYVTMEVKNFGSAQATSLESCYFTSLQNTLNKLGLKCETRIFPGGTDSRFLRQLDIPAFGFSPIINHPVLLHDNDEYLSVEMFQHAIDIYVHVIKALAHNMYR